VDQAAVEKDGGYEAPPLPVGDQEPVFRPEPDERENVNPAEQEIPAEFASPNADRREQHESEQEQVHAQQHRGVASLLRQNRIERPAEPGLRDFRNPLAAQWADPVLPIDQCPASRAHALLVHDRLEEAARPLHALLELQLVAVDLPFRAWR